MKLSKKADKLIKYICERYNIGYVDLEGEELANIFKDPVRWKPVVGVVVEPAKGLEKEDSEIAIDKLCAHSRYDYLRLALAMNGWEDKDVIKFVECPDGLFDLTVSDSYGYYHHIRVGISDDGMTQMVHLDDLKMGVLDFMTAIFAVLNDCGVSADMVTNIKIINPSSYEITCGGTITMDIYEHYLEYYISNDGGRTHSSRLYRSIFKVKSSSSGMSKCYYAWDASTARQMFRDEYSVFDNTEVSFIARDTEIVDIT